MDRREFFRSALRRGAKTVVDHAEEKVEQQAKRWIRPPFAVNELDFLLACSRCGDCVPACPHNVVFTLPARLGSSVVGTPALDLVNKGCHLCEEWPCVQACNDGALLLPAIDNQNERLNPQDPSAGLAEDYRPQPIKLAVLSIGEQACLPFQGPECGACEASCPVDGALTWNRAKPEINPQLCLGCGLCREACITDPAAIVIQTLTFADSEPTNRSE